MTDVTGHCCQRCGILFPSSKRSDAKFCVGCRKLEDQEQASAWYYAHRHEPRVKAIRRKAKLKRYAKERADPELMAARNAAIAKWRDENREQMSAQWKAWYSENKDKVRAKTLKRRARLLNAFVADVSLAEVWERDGGVCGICLELIDPGLKWPDRMSTTLDHVIPLSRGGTHEPGNVQLAHAVCNCRKNDRIG